MRFARLRLGQTQPKKKPVQDQPETLYVTMGSQTVAVALRRSNRARRLTLRLDQSSGEPVLTIPARVGLSQAQEFLDRHTGWIARQRDKLPEARPFGHDHIFPLRGEDCRIVHQSGRGLVRLQGTDQDLAIIVPGDARHLQRRLTDWLKSEARSDLETSVARCTDVIGRKPSRIRIGDAKSRWGSCSSTGTLSFSWRLVLAPPHILDYLAAHETAHLIEMNHGRNFWKLVETLDPHYERAQKWLKSHGPGLQLIGRSPVPGSASDRLAS